MVSGTVVPPTLASTVRSMVAPTRSATRNAKNVSGLLRRSVCSTTVPSAAVVAAGMSPDATSTRYPAGKTTRAVLPDVDPLANAQTGNVTSESPTRTWRRGLAARVDDVEDQPILRRLAAVQA